jgi:hypothetical protein
MLSMNPRGGPWSAHGARPAIDPDLGVRRFGLAMVGLLAAGVDVRTRDVGWAGPASNPLELLLLVAFVVLLADSVVWPRQAGAVLSTAWRSNRWLTGYFAWAMVAGIAGILQFSLSLFVFRNLLPAFVVFVLLVQSMRALGDLKSAFGFFLLAALPNLLLGLVQGFNGGPFPVRLNAASAVKMDIDGSFVSAAVSGLFTHPNALSVFLMPIALVAFGMLFSRLRLGVPERMLVGALLVSTLVLIYFTRAKGAWAWGAFGIALLCLPKRWLCWRGAWVAQVLLVCALVTAMTLASLHLGGSLRTIETRMQLWQTTLYAAQTNPVVAILGSGQGIVWNASARLADLQYANAHNVFLNQVVNFGFPGAVLYLLAFALAIRQSQQAMRLAGDGELRRLAHIANSCLLAMAGQYFFEPAAESSGLAVACFFFMAVSAVSLREARRR